MTEGDLAARLARDLGPLAVDAGWLATPSAGQPQGHYSDPIADAKEAMQIDGELADVSAFDRAALRDRALLGCLERLELHYATLVDTTGGEGATQKLSQVQAAIATVRKRVAVTLSLREGVARGVAIRGRRRPDYSLGSGDEED